MIMRVQSNPNKLVQCISFIKLEKIVKSGDLKLKPLILFLSKYSTP